MKKYLLTLLASALVTSANLHADTFGTGANQFTIDFTTIGNPGNSADTAGYGYPGNYNAAGYGAVGYTYRIGTFDISQNQIDKATSSGMLNVVAGAWSGDKPAANMSWYESAAFVNWLNVSKGFQPAYNLTWSGSTWSMALWTVTDAGYDANNLYRNSLAKYFLPSENEFYKAAYGKSDGSGYYLYPTASDTTPTAIASGTSAGTAVYNYQSAPSSVYTAGGLSSYGIMAGGGNVYQWQESAYDGVNNDVAEDRVIRGGSYEYSGYMWGEVNTGYDLRSLPRTNHPSSSYAGDYTIGFRVASQAIPEPSTYALFGIGAIGMLMVMRRKKTA